MQEILSFRPIYQERVWGGRGLESSLGRNLPAEKVIGESWELVDREEADSPGIGDGGSLGSLRKADPEALMGPGWPADKPFPILVKWLDCQQRLSLQVHPPKEIAPSLGGEPKTENWYIVETSGDAALLAGLKPGIDRETFIKALEDDDLERLVERFPAQKGDSLFVRSGWIHAIDAGNLILEIQQNSDTTYRVYDWGRVGLDGTPRQLHIDASMQSIDFSDVQPKPVRPEGKESLLADCEEFRLRRIVLEEGEELAFSAGEEPRILSIVEGSLVAEGWGSAQKGDNVILPYSGNSSWKAATDVVLLLTDHFNRRA